MSILSKKGILFLTSGFNQPYVLQIITCFMDIKQLTVVNQEKKLGKIQEKQFKAILTDGQIYISAIYPLKYQSQKDIKIIQNLKDFDIIRIEAIYQGSIKPILIETLEVLSNDQRGIQSQTGFPPISVHDFLLNRLASKQKKSQKSLQKQNKKLFQKNPVCLNFNSQSQKNIQINDKIQAFSGYSQKQQNQKTQVSSNHQKQIQKIIEILQISSFDNSDSQSQNQFLNALYQKSKKRSNRKRTQLIQNLPQKQQKEIQNIQKQMQPSKKVKLNQNKEQKTNIFYEKEQQDNQKEIQIQNQIWQIQEDHTQKINQKINNRNLHFNDVMFTQKNNEYQSQIMQVQVTDLEDMKTQREKISFFQKPKKNSHRKEYQNNLQKVYKSTEIEYQKTNENKITYNQDEPTIPLSQTIILQQNQTTDKIITPIKLLQHNAENCLSMNRIGSKTEKRMVQEEYNIFISNLYEDNKDFKILCRVNHLAESRSKKGLPYLTAIIIDSQGYQIKAIIHINHLRSQCEQCNNILQIGKVYTFQNGQCKRSFQQKDQLELIFYLRSKYQQINFNQTCNLQKKIQLRKNQIMQIHQNKILSLPQIVQMYDAGKKYNFTTYGILKGFRASQYCQKNTKNINFQNNQQNSSQPMQFQYHQPNKQKNQINMTQTQQKSNINRKIYFNGVLLDPILKKQIQFKLILLKPESQNNLSKQQFLQINGIRKGALLVLHNMKLVYLNNQTVRKIDKTKTSYIQIVVLQTKEQKQTKSMKKMQNQQFVCEKIILNQNKQEQIFKIFKQMLNFKSSQIEQILRNPRFVNYSQQPYTLRTINQMNQIIQSVLSEETCHSQIHDAKIHFIQQKNTIQICILCKKKVKNENSSKLVKICTKCKKIVKTKQINIFNIVFADITGSFSIQITQDSFIETIIQLPILQFKKYNQEMKINYLEKVKYSNYIIKVKSERKVGGIVHKLTALAVMPAEARIKQIHNQRIGIPKHQKRLESSW